MRLFFLVPVSFLLVALNLPSPSIRLPELPEQDPHTFYYLQVMTAHEHGRVVTNADQKPIKIRLAVKITTFEEGHEEEHIAEGHGNHATIVIRDTQDYHNCEQLTDIEVGYRTSHRGTHYSIDSRTRNAEGQEFEIDWRFSTTAVGDELRKFIIYTQESTHIHPINFISLPADNLRINPIMSSAEIAKNYFSGANPNCD